MTKKVVVLNDTQYNNKEIKEEFESGGIKVVKDAPVPNTSKEEKKPEPIVITSNAVKLKDRPTRDSYAIDLNKMNFVPDIIVIAKVKGKNNTIRVMAIKNVKNSITNDGKSDKSDTKEKGK